MLGWTADLRYLALKSRINKADADPQRDLHSFSELKGTIGDCSKTTGRGGRLYGRLGLTERAVQSQDLLPTNRLKTFLKPLR